MAAGEGKRLHPFTLKSPKPLLEVGQESLLQRSLDALSSAGIKDVVMITGYKRESLRRVTVPSLRITYQFNPFYRSTDDMVSLWFARPHVDGKDFLHLHGDLLYHPEILHRCLNERASAILYDSSEFDKEAMKIKVEKGLYVESRKNLPARLTSGEFVGINKFTASVGACLFQEVELLMQGGKFRAYDTEALNNIAKHVKLLAIDIAGLPWIEIDSPDDLKMAQREILPRIEASAGSEQA